MKSISKILIIVVLTFFFNKIYAQEDTKSLDFIIVVDGEIFDHYTKFNIVRYHKGQIDKLLVNYWPGNLSIKKSDYENLISKETDSILLYIEDNRYINGKQNENSYEIEIKKPWLQDYYNILRIYNLNNKKNKGLEPLSKDKNYTFELSSPSHTFLRIRKK